MPELDSWSGKLSTHKNIANLLNGLQKIRHEKDLKFQAATEFFAGFENKKIAIFGSGQAGYRCFRQSKHICKVVCFLDNDLSKTGSFIDGVEVRSLQGLNISDIEVICIASQFHAEISYQLSIMKELASVKILVWK